MSGETDGAGKLGDIDEVEAHDGSETADREDRMDRDDGRPPRHVSIEICDPPAPDGDPQLDAGTRVDTMVKDRLLPTARLDDGRYVAWWFDTDAPGPYDEATSEWVVAPTRFLAAATFRELTEDPARFEALVSADENGVVE